VERRKHQVLTKKGKSSFRWFDKTLFIYIVVLSILGIIAVADASAPQALEVFGDSFYFVKQQIVWTLIGFAGMFVVSFIDYKIWKKLAPVIFIVSLALLLVVFIPGVGSKVLGARRWVNLGFFGFQPSEVAKISLAIFIAWLASYDYPFKYYIATVGLVAFLIMLQPDLGTTIVIIGIAVVQMFISGLPIIYMIGFGLLGAGGGSLLVLLSDYRRQRLMTFLESSTDPLGTSYHIRQILIALGSGGLLGVGLGQSRQKHLFLPETATDSVFAVIAEEIGFVGAAFLIILLFLFVFRTIKISSKSPDKFGLVLGGGLAAWLGGQIFLNVASMVALVPLTGIPLPFFSYGGSSQLMILISVGILLNISRHVEKEEK